MNDIDGMEFRGETDRRGEVGMRRLMGERGTCNTDGGEGD